MVSALSRALLLLALTIALPVAAHAAAANAPLAHREEVDQSRYPWSALGKLTNETGASCSAVMVASDKVLTAAHCLYNFRARRFVTAGSLHFLLGYRSGHYSVHGRVSLYEIGPGFDPQRYSATSGADWALLTLTEELPAGIVPLKFSDGAASFGTKAMLAGYTQDRAYALTADRDCELRGEIDRGRLMVHTCRGVHGTSGAPILIGAGNGEVWIAGIQIAAMQANGFETMIAVPVQAVWRQQLDSAPADSPSACIAESGEVAPGLQAVRDRLGLDPVPTPAELIAQWQDWPPEPALPKTMAWLAREDFFIAMP